MKEEKTFDALLKITTMMHASLGVNKTGLSYIRTMEKILNNKKAKEENKPS